jgi:serine/threonine protein kinase/HEAT repeat protein
MDAGNYTILARLGEGPLGALYEGAHKQTQERVVVRILAPTVAREPNILGRLLALQRALFRLEPERSVVMPLRGAGSPGAGDPSVAGIIECGRMPEGGLFVVSEFVTGESLATQLRRHAGLPLPNKALRLGRQLSATLAVAHASNIQHLALRPEKILLAHVPGTVDAEHLKILDLGLYTALSRVPRAEELPTSAVPYLAPEYRRGESSYGGQPDVFALGVILYEIGSGGLPASVKGTLDSGGSVSGALATAEAQTGLMQMLPSWLQPFAELLDRMLAPMPADRPSMAQVAALLQQLHALAPNPSGTSLPPSQSSAPPSLSTPKMPSMQSKPPEKTPSAQDSAATPKAQLQEELVTPPIATPPIIRRDPSAPTAEVSSHDTEKMQLPDVLKGFATLTMQDEVTPTGPRRESSVPPVTATPKPSEKTPPKQPIAAPSPAPVAAPPVASQKTPEKPAPAVKSAGTPPPKAAPGPEENASVIEIPMTEEMTLSSEPTHMSAPVKPGTPSAKQSARQPAVPAKAQDEPSGELEIQAEYTMNPRGPHDPTGAQTGGGGTGAGGSTAATGVEPGLAGGANLRVGQLVGNFRIVSKIGQGGMGAVYAAVHRQIGRRAAIKVLHGSLARTADYTARFLNEARAVNILRHPNLVEIFDFGQLPDGTLYIIMEFLEGESLRAKLRRTHRLPEPMAVELALQMGRALESAHQKNIVHRDLKPENVMLVADSVRPDEERIKILDFGIAKVTQGSPGANATPNVPSTIDPDSQEFQTAIGTTMGTPKYMAPEQYGDASKVDGKADVFALGVMLYEMVSGQVPFAKTSLSAFHQAPKPVAEVYPAVSPRLAAVIHRMMTPKASDRPSMHEALEQLTPPPPPVAVNLPPPPAPLPTSGRLGWITLAFFVVAAGLTGIAAYKGWLRPPAPPVEPTEEQADLLIDTAGPKARALGVLYKGLRSSDAALRSQAARALGQSRDVSQWSSIAALLKDPDPVVQAEAAEALGHLGASDANPELLAALETNLPPGVRVTVAGALTRLVHPRGPVLLRGMLGDGDERIRLRAALLLLESGDTSAVEPLRAALNKGNLPDDIVVHILGRLAQTGDGPSQQQLQLRMAGEEYSQRRISAAGQLAKLGDERARLLLVQGAQKPGPQQLISALLLATVGDTSGYGLFKRTAVDAKLPMAARQVSMDGLGACGRRQGAVLLAAVLDEPTASPALRQVAAGAILQITGGDPNQVAKQGLSWAQAALGHDDWLVRQSATAVLADLDNDQSVPLLAKALTDTKGEVRRSAATALGQKSARSALSALRVTLDDAEPEVRQAGLKAMVNLLGTLGAVGSRSTDELTRTRLRELVDSGTPEEQLIASATLLRLGDEAQRGRLRTGLASENPVLRKLTVETLPGEERDLLKEALGDTDPPVRFMAAKRLGALGQREAAPILRESLSAGGADGLIAYSLLKKLGEPVTLPAGASALLGRDPATSLALLDVVPDMPKPEALALLNKARFDQAPVVRKRVGEVAAAMYKKGPDPALLSVIYSLLSDPDIHVRARLGVLLGNLMKPKDAAEKSKLQEEPPPDLAAPAEDLAPAEPATGKGTLRVSGEQWVRFSVDNGAAHTLGAAATVLPVDAGRHVVSFHGGSVEVNVTAGQTATAQVTGSYAEQLLGDAADAVQRRDGGRAQQLLDRARNLIARGRGLRTAQGELHLLQARVFELSGRWAEGMVEIERMFKLPEGMRKAEYNAAAHATQSRLASHLGRIKVSKAVDGRCMESTQWVRPGEHVIDGGGGGQPRVVRVREGATVNVNLCQGGAP